MFVIFQKESLDFGKENNTLGGMDLKMYGKSVA